MNTKMLDHYIAQSILHRVERKEDINGAPYKIGQRVIVLDNPHQDQTFEKMFIGKVGDVIFFEYACGCGQSFPADPMIGIKFPNGKVEEFWKDEIALLPEE